MNEGSMIQLRRAACFIRNQKKWQSWHTEAKKINTAKRGSLRHARQ